MKYTLKKAIELAKELGGEGSRFVYEEEGSISIPDPSTILHSGFVRQEGAVEYPSTGPEKKSKVEIESSKARKIFYGIVAGLTALAGGFGAAYYFDPGFKDSVNKNLIEMNKKLINVGEFLFEHEKYKLKRMDSDGDGVSDWEEIQKGTNPYLTPEEEELKRQKKLKLKLKEEFYNMAVKKSRKRGCQIVDKKFISV